MNVCSTPDNKHFFINTTTSKSSNDIYIYIYIYIYSIAYRYVHYKQFFIKI